MISRHISYYKSEKVIIGIISLVLAFILGIWLTEYSTKQIAFIILAIIGIVVGVLKPKIPLFLFFLFVPLESLTLIPSQTLTKLIGLFLGCLFFMELAVTKKISLPQGRKSLWILIYGFVAISSLLVSRDVSISVIFLITLWLLIGLFFITFFIMRDIKTLHISILCLLIGGFLSIIITQITGYGWVSRGLIVKGTRSFETFTRYGGLSGDSSDLASNLLVLMPLSLLQFFRSKSVFMKGLTLGLFAIFLFAFFNTYSRGGFIGLSVLLILGAFKFDLLKKGSNKSKIIIFTMFIAIIGIIVFSMVPETFIARIKTLTSLGSAIHSHRGDTAINARYEAYTDALRVFLDHPVLGVGIRNFYLFNPAGVVHNTYLEVLACTGLAGFIPFVAILYLSWRELRMVQNLARVRDNQNSLSYQYAIALELGFLAYLVSVLFYTADLKKMAWLLIILSSVLWSISVKQSQVKRGNELFRKGK